MHKIQTFEKLLDFISGYFPIVFLLEDIHFDSKKGLIN